MAGVSEFFDQHRQIVGRSRETEIGGLPQARRRMADAVERQRLLVEQGQARRLGGIRGGVFVGHVGLLRLIRLPGRLRLPTYR